jgi:hypothetical protein
MTTAVLVGTVGTRGAVAGAAPDGLPRGPSVTTPGWAATGHAKSAVGTYEIFLAGDDLGPLVLGLIRPPSSPVSTTPASGSRRAPPSPSRSRPRPSLATWAARSAA